MKKILVLSMMLLLSACACHNGCCNRGGNCACHSERCRKKHEAQTPTPVAEEAPAKAVRTEIIPIMYEGKVDVAKTEPVVPATVVIAEPAMQEIAPVTTEVVAPAEVSGSYGCAVKANCQTLEPIVLKPRVTEVVGAENKRPCCDDDNSWMQDENAETYVPNAPEIYVIAANRAFNTMQEEAAPLFKQIGKMKVYIGEATPKSDDLPGGIEKGMKILKKRFEQMDNVLVVKNKFVADYSVDSTADWYDTPTKTVPAIKYDITFKDRGGNLIGEWSEIIHQAEGDRSWW